MRVLITGITGFAGSHLADILLERGDVELHGMERWRSKTDNIDHIKSKIVMHECDLRDASSIRKVLELSRPDRIFHLAAQSFVPTSWSAPAESLTTNIIGQLNIFEAVRHLGVNPWIQIAGSSEEYGMVYPDEIPIKESNPLRPLSPYAVSKVGQDLLAYQYHQSFKLNVVRTRGFNHTGPRRGNVFVESNFAQQIARIERGVQEPVIKVGNLKAKRDYTDVRDMVRAYWLALEKGEPGEVYNICSGTAFPIESVLQKLLGMSTVKVRVEQDPARMRPSDVELLQGDNGKFVARTGWKPQIGFDKTLRDLLEYWRERIGAYADRV
ncbi:MAG: GDP-mannose 4,6-dehydratase [Candidatus Omnitrophica bacterium]|nr:GDP-mannose 4,6-dehydratase [Candidatus Omnitrophota bacterium]